MHITAMDKGMLGADAIVAGSSAIAVGAAHGLRLQGRDSVVVCFFGDGAANQGILHEACNLAAVLSAPVVFVCENNEWAISTPASASTRVDDLAIRAAGYGFPGVVADGNDVLGMRDVTAAAVARARAGDGPTLIEAKSYRVTPHSAATKTDLRPPQELDAWRARDPILRFSRYLSEEAGVEPARLEEIEEPGAARRRGGGRVREGLAAPRARGRARGRLRAGRLAHAREARMTDARELTMSEALNEALHEEMERDPTVFVVGEDIANMGGLFQVTSGLLDRFGSQRVIDAPISEAAQAGAGVGAALVGCRPVVELQIADFVSLVMDQVVNHAGKWRYMSGGRVTVPFVLRGAVSSGIGMAAQHSQTLEAWFVHAPGLVVIMPSTPYDAKGLLKSAIRDDNPVVFLEKRLLYSRPGPVPEGEYTVPIGVAVRSDDHPRAEDADDSRTALFHCLLGLALHTSVARHPRGARSGRRRGGISAGGGHERQVLHSPRCLQPSCKGRIQLDVDRAMLVERELRGAGPDAQHTQPDGIACERTNGLRGRSFQTGRFHRGNERLAQFDTRLTCHRDLSRLRTTHQCHDWFDVFDCESVP